MGTAISKRGSRHAQAVEAGHLLQALPNLFQPTEKLQLEVRKAQ
jgi:hypothetical protein